MLDLAPAIRKNSFRAGTKNLREVRIFEKLGELAVPGAREEGQSGAGREGSVPQQGTPDSGPKAPSGVGGDDVEGAGLRLRPGRGLHDVRLGGKSVVEKGGDNPWIRVETHRLQGPAARRPGQVDPLG